MGIHLEDFWPVQSAPCQAEQTTRQVNVNEIDDTLYEDVIKLVASEYTSPVVAEMKKG